MNDDYEINEIKAKTVSMLKIWSKCQMEESIYQAFFKAFVKKYVKIFLDSKI